MENLLDFIGMAAEHGIKIPRMDVPRDVYDALCVEGEYDGEEPCPVVVHTDNGDFHTAVYVINEDLATNRSLS